MYGADMLFPIYNAKAEKNGAIFGQTENAFASGDGKALTNTVCPLSADGDAYFLSMGGQAPSLQMFTFKQQYDTFHASKVDRPVRQRWHDAQGSGLFEYGFICEGLGVMPVQLPVIACVAWLRGVEIGDWENKRL